MSIYDHAGPIEAIENKGEKMETTESRKDLIMALAKVQGKIQNPKKDTDNPFFKSKFADLAATWDSVRDLLAENGLAFMQLPTVDGNKVSIQGILFHVSGQSIESTLTGQAKDSMPQSIGSCITYLRRYQMAPMLGIVSEADDDGNAASFPPGKEKTLAQQKGPFSAGIPKAQFDLEQAEKEQARTDKTVEAGVTGAIENPNRDLGDFRDYIITGAPENFAGKYKGWRIGTQGHGELITFLEDVMMMAKQAKTDKAMVFIQSEPSNFGPKITSMELVKVLAV